MITQNWTLGAKSYSFLKSSSNKEFNINKKNIICIYVFGIILLILFLIILNAIFIYYIYCNTYDIQKLREELEFLRQDINLFKYALPDEEILKEISKFESEAYDDYNNYNYDSEEDDALLEIVSKSLQNKNNSTENTKHKRDISTVKKNGTPEPHEKSKQNNITALNKNPKMDDGFGRVENISRRYRHRQKKKHKNNCRCVKTRNSKRNSYTGEEMVFKRTNIEAYRLRGRDQNKVNIEGDKKFTALKALDSEANEKTQLTHRNSTQKTTYPRKLQKRHGPSHTVHPEKFHIHLNGGDRARSKPEFAGNTYVNWSPSSWSNRDFYSLTNGVLRIKQGGLYFIYAQICYSDSREKNGYQVYKNESVIAQCSTIMLHRNETTTCYTAVVDYLPEGTVVYIRDISPPITLLFTKARSFFGLIQLTIQT